jgi:hypothetical protein
MFFIWWCKFIFSMKSHIFTFNAMLTVHVSISYFPIQKKFLLRFGSDEVWKKIQHSYSIVQLLVDLSKAAADLIVSSSVCLDLYLLCFLFLFYWIFWYWWFLDCSQSSSEFIGCHSGCYSICYETWISWQLMDVNYCA